MNKNIISLILIGAFLLGGLYISNPNLLSITSVQKVDIEDEGKNLRISMDITRDLDGFRFTLPEEQKLDSNHKVVIGKPMTFQIEQWSYYTSAPTEEHKVTGVLSKAGGWLGQCIGDTRKVDINYLTMAGSQQNMKLRVVTYDKKGDKIGSSKFPVVNPDSTSRWDIGDEITLQFPGWLSRGVNSPPVNDLVYSNGQVYDLEPNEFESQLTTYLGSEGPQATWDTWIQSCGNCEKEFTRDEILNGAVDWDNGCTDWRGLKKFDLPASNVKTVTYNKDKKELWFYHDTYGGSGRVTVTLPKEYIDAKVVELVNEVKPDIVNAPNQISINENQEKIIDVDVKNIGTDAGRITVVADVPGVDSNQVDKYLNPGGQGTVSLSLHQNAISEDTKSCGKIKAYGGKYTATKDICVEGKDVIVEEEPQPHNPMKAQLTIDRSNLVGAVVGFESQGAVSWNYDDTSFLMKKKQTEIDDIFGLHTKGDMDVLDALVLQKITVTSNHEFDVVVDGEKQVEGTTRYVYTNNYAYLSLIIPILILLVAMFAPLRRR